MDDTQVGALRDQVNHWQQKFREEEHHNRELQQELETAMADRGKLSSDLRLKTILMEDMSKELEELKLYLSTYNCTDRSKSHQEVVDQESGPESEENALQGRFGREDTQFALRMLNVERQLQWMLRKNVEDQTKQLGHRMTKIEELEAQVTALSTERDTLAHNLAEQTQLRQDTEEVVGRLNSRMKEQRNDLQEQKAQLTEINGQLQKSAEEASCLKKEKQTLQEQISAMNLSLQTLYKDVQNKATAIDQQSKHVEELTTRVNEMDKSDQALSEKLKEIESTLHERTTENESLSSRIQELEHDVITKDRQLEGMQNDTEVLKLNVKDKERARLSLCDEVKDMKATIEQTTKENNSLTENMEKLKVDIETTDKKKKVLEWCLETEEIKEGDFESEMSVLDSKMSYERKTYVLKILKEYGRQHKHMGNIAEAVVNNLVEQYGQKWGCFIGRNYNYSTSNIRNNYLLVTVNGIDIEVLRIDASAT